MRSPALPLSRSLLRTAGLVALTAAAVPSAAHGAPQGPPPQPIYFLSDLNIADGGYLHVLAGTTVVVDMEPSNNLGGVWVEGQLVLDTTLDQPELRAAWILVGTSSTGYACQLSMGTYSDPVPSDCLARITLLSGGITALDPRDPLGNASEDPVASVEPDGGAHDDDVRDMLEMALDDGGLVVYERGKLLSFGHDFGVPWTSLTAQANSSSTNLTVAGTGPSAWDELEIVIASTDFDHAQAQKVKVTSVGSSGGNTTLTLATGLENDHYHLNYPATGKSGAAWTVDEIAEVGLLERNAIIRAQRWDSNASDWVDGIGEHGHVMICGNEWDPSANLPVARVTWTRFLNLGIVGKVMSYPLHYHFAGDQGSLTYPSFVQDSSFTHCFNKFLALHATQNMEVSGNVGYDTIGNGFYLEDEMTTGIVLRNNLGLGTRAITPEEWGSAPSGKRVPDEDREPGVFWYVSPDNEIAENHAAGSSDYGFWYSPVADEDFLIDGDESCFENNVAHSNGQHGFYQDKVATNGNSPRARPWHTGQPQMDGCTSYKNRRYGFWVRSYGRVFLNNLKAADNRSGFYFASDGIQRVTDDGPSSALRTLSRITLANSLAIGETTNVGMAGSGSGYYHEVDAGRSLPQPAINWDGDRPHDLAWAFLSGIDMYDGLVELDTVNFGDFQDLPNLNYPTNQSLQAHRPAAAITQVAYDSQFMIDPRNMVAGLEFAAVNHKVAFRYPSVAVHGANMIKNTIVFDDDGSLNTLSQSDVYMIPTEPMLVVGLTAGTHYNTSTLGGVGVWQVPAANADYASLVIETSGSPSGAQNAIEWTKVTYLYPIPGSGLITESVHTTTNVDEFPLTLALNKKYTLAFLQADEVTPVTTLPNNVWLNLRFAGHTGQYVTVAVPWSGTPSAVEVDGAGAFFETTLSGLNNSSVNAYCLDNGYVVVKFFTKMPFGYTDLIDTGIQNVCHIH